MYLVAKYIRKVHCVFGCQINKENTLCIWWPGILLKYIAYFVAKYIRRVHCVLAWFVSRVHCVFGGLVKNP